MVMEKSGYFPPFAPLGRRGVQGTRGGSNVFLKNAVSMCLRQNLESWEFLRTAGNKVSFCSSHSSFLFVLRT